jgi:hypothetical protein
MPAIASILVGQQESVVAEMVITIADGHIEGHSTIELTKNLLHVTTVLEYEIAICKVNSFSLFYVWLLPYK